MFGGFTTRRNFGQQLFPSRILGQLGGQTQVIADRFITTAGITGTTEINAINLLVADLIYYGLINKFVAVYPMIGGTSVTTSYNLIDPRVFRITWLNAVVFASTGVRSSGSVNNYGNTNIPALTTGAFNGHLSFYGRLNTVGTCSAMGAGVQFNPTYRNSIVNTLAAPVGSYNGENAVTASTIVNNSGLWTVSRTNNSLIEFYQGSTLLGTNTTAQTSRLGTENIIILGILQSTGGVVPATLQECQFATIGQSLTAAEVANLNTSIVNFQTNLGR